AVGQVAEDRLDGAGALVDEDHLVALAVAEEVLHCVRRAAEADLDVVVPHQYAAAGDRVAARVDAHRGHVPVHMRVRDPLLALDRLERPELLDTARRLEVVEDRLVAGEALEAQDFLGEEGPGLPMLDVPLARNLAEALIERHERRITSVRTGMTTAKRIRAEVASWDGVSVEPHRLGGIEFRLGRRELGHLHGDRFADLPFTRALRD